MLYFLDCPRAKSVIDTTSAGNDQHIFQTDATKSTKLIELILIQKLFQWRVISQGTVQQMINKINSWFYSQYHILLNDAGCSQFSKSGSVNSLRVPGQVSTNIVRVNSCGLRHRELGVCIG